MFDLESCDPRLLQVPERVLRALQDDHGLDIERTLLVGARCRDILNSAYGRPRDLSTTTDLDLGLALKDWEEFERLRARLPARGDSGIRFEVADVPVDLMPFGQVERPAGSVEPPQRGEPVDVTGFKDVDRRASLRLRLQQDLTLRLASPIGFTALKLKAWADRSQQPDYRDAADLAAACSWFAGDEVVADELYSTAAGIEVIEACDFDLEVAAAQWLGRGVRDVLSAESQRRLQAAWNAVTTTTLIAYFTTPAVPAAAEPVLRRRLVVEGLLRGAAVEI